MTVSFRKGRYGVAFARDGADLRACQALRHLAFHGRAGVDQDRFDPLCTHIMVADETGLVATCRVMSLSGGQALGQSYAAERYDLTRLARYDRPMLELGRFCLRPDRQDADILRLAWGALAQMADDRGAGMIFGCTSFAGTCAERHAGAFALLADRALGPAVWAPEPAGGVEIRLLRNHGSQGVLSDLPPLLRSYLSLGGWVSDHAVIDHDMQTLHVFTALELDAVPARRAATLRQIASPGGANADGGPGLALTGVAP